MRYQTLRHYDPFTDSDMMRVSVFDHAGQEYWRKVPANTHGKKRRDVIEEALDVIADAMDRREQPGEVTCTGTI